MSHSSKSKGFTLAEMLVSIGIISVITAVVLTSQSGYTDEASLHNEADGVALYLSQAQAYGIGVKEFGVGSSNFSSGYGTVFNMLGGSKTEYNFFADLNGNRVYDGSWDCPTGGTSECLEKARIANGNLINKICELQTSGGENCNFSHVEVTYKRPNPQPTFVFFDLAGIQQSLPDILGARIELQSPKGRLKSVRIYNTGQVSVQ